MPSLSDILFGKKGKMQQVSTLGQEQKPLYEQLTQAGMGSGAGGAFGESADYYRNLLGQTDEQQFQDIAAPELRRFQQETVPGLAEQFAGMGSGALSSSGFQQAGTQAGVDLSERLAALRANLRQQNEARRMQAAQGLMGIGQQGLGQFVENIYRPAQQGLTGGLAQGLGQGLGKAAGAYFNPFGAAGEAVQDAAPSVPSAPAANQIPMSNRSPSFSNLNYGISRY